MLPATGKPGGRFPNHRQLGGSHRVAGVDRDSGRDEVIGAG